MTDSDSNGYFYVSTWLGHLVKHYCWVSLWRYFQKRTACESVNWVKQVDFPSVNRHLLSLKSAFFIWDVHLLPPSYFLVSQTLRFWQNLQYYWLSVLKPSKHSPGFPGSPSSKWKAMGLLDFHNCANQL